MTIDWFGGFYAENPDSPQSLLKCWLNIGNMTCIAPEIPSLSLRISWRFFVPRMFLSVVCDNNLTIININIISISISISPPWTTWCCGERSPRWPHWRWRCWPCSTPPRPLGGGNHFNHIGEKFQLWVSVSLLAKMSLYFPWRIHKGTKVCLDVYKWNDPVPETVTLSLVRTYPVSLYQRISFILFVWSDLLRWHAQGYRSQINFLIGFNAGHHEEYT